MKDNKITHPVIIIWSAIIILLILSSVKLPVIPYLNNYSHIDILQDLRPGKTRVTSPIKKQQPAIATKAASNKQPANLFDSALIADYASDTTGNMRSFYNKLNALKSTRGKVRIAYFGDSFIEGDFITGQLRSKLQQLYGGNGVGFVPMQSIVAGDYATIDFDDNTSWNDYNFHNNPLKYSLGLMGHVFYSKGKSWSQYSAVGKPFKNVYLLTGEADAIDTILVEQDGKEGKIAIPDDAVINRTPLTDGSPVNKIKITCTNSSLPVYGVSFEDDNGVYVDNYGFRGNTGALTLQLQPEIMKGFNAAFNYDLIILHYGLNAVVHNDTNYAWFDRCMAKLIQNIRSSYPGVPVLLVSTSDIAYNEQGTYITDPAVPVLVRRQNEIARKNKTAFWNLYYAMGGENTMANWVDGDTTLAYKDYMHVNQKGANKIAGIFLDKILQSQKN